MKELNNKPEVAAVCDEKPVCFDSGESTPFSRLVEEKRALDEKIVKLNAFLEDEERLLKSRAFGSSDKCASSSTLCCAIRAF